MSTSPEVNKNRRSFTADERVQILKEGEEIGVMETCEKHGIHFTTWYDWRGKFRKDGEAGLETKKAVRKGGRAARRPPSKPGRRKQCSRNGNRTPASARRRPACRQAGRQSTPPPAYSDQYPHRDCHHEETRLPGAKSSRTQMPATLRGEPPARAGADLPAGRQVDILEFYIHKAKTHLALLIDDFSRFLLGYALLESPSTEPIAEMVKASVQRYGKMETLLADRGSVFFSWQGLTRFEKYIDDAGILMTHASPGHPQTLGKIEAVNKSIQKELLRVEKFKDLSETEEAIGRWVEHYNYCRTHQGLGGLLVPADRFHGRAESARQTVLESVSQQTSGNLTWPLQNENTTLDPRTASVFQICSGPSGLEVWLLGERLWPPAQSITQPS